MADHNDPNAVNSIFSDVDVSAADIYDMFGYPNDASDEEKVVLALTFASIPEAGVLDSDLLYRLQLHTHPRVAFQGDQGLDGLLSYFEAVKDKYLVGFHPMEIR